MATNGKLDSVKTVAGVNVTAFAGDSGYSFITANIRMVNIGANDASVKLAITTSANPSDVDYIEYNAVIAANGGVLERTCVILGPNEKVVVNATTATVVVRVDGLVQN